MRLVSLLTILAMTAIALGGEDPIAERLLARGGEFTAERVAEVLSHATPPDRFRALAEWSFERFPRHPDDFELLRVVSGALRELFPGERSPAESFRWFAEEGRSSYVRDGWVSVGWQFVPEEDLLRVLDAWADSDDPERRFLATRGGRDRKAPERFREVAFRLVADPEARVRWGAADALGYAEPGRAEPVLLGRIREEPEPFVFQRVLGSYVRIPELRRRLDPETLIRACLRLDGDPDRVADVRERAMGYLWPTMAEDARTVADRENVHRFLAGLDPAEDVAAVWAAAAARALYRDEDVPALAKTLLDTTAKQASRIRALGALVFVGTDEALAALDEFRRLADRREPFPRPFRRGVARDLPSPHMAGGRLRFLAETDGEDGRRGVLLAAPSLGGLRLAVARALPGSRDSFEGELVTGIPCPVGGTSIELAVRGGRVRVRWIGGKEPVSEHSLALADLLRDTDADGLTDLLERALGTDPAAADSDGDGEDDTTDPFPLLPPAPVTEETEILAAAWAGLLGTSGASGLVVFDARCAPSGGLSGFPGPALVDSEALRELTAGSSGPMRVRRFEVEERGGDRARVRFEDETGGSPGGSKLVLRRVAGRWLVSGILWGPPS